MSHPLNRRQKIAAWCLLLAIAGLAAFFSSFAYECHAFKTNPTSADATHTVEWAYRGRRRFFTPFQYQLCTWLPPIAMGEYISMLLLSVYLGKGTKTNQPGQAPPGK